MAIQYFCLFLCVFVTLQQYCFQMTSVLIQVQELDDHLIIEKQTKLSVLREDLVHPLTGGNKWRKLKYNLQLAKDQGHNTLLTFGGAFSNHLVATAVAGKENGFKTIGLVRGEETLPLNKSLQMAVDHGMQLHYLSREQYRIYRNPETHPQLKTQFGDCYILPEGGSNLLAVKGCSEMLTDANIDFDIVCVAVGTGATLAGIISALKPHQSAIGFCVLKNASQIKTDIENWLTESDIKNSNWSLMAGYHFGGYAKSNHELLNFVDQFSRNNKIPIEPIYTGKLFYGIFDLTKKDFFQSGTKILAIHTGGLQYLDHL